MNIYLDIDGVILTKEGKPAKNLDLLLEYITNNHDVYWLTTHCKGDAKYTVNYISRYFKPKTIKYLNKIKPTTFNTLKTEAINFDSDFLWLDDYLFDSEIQILKEKNKESKIYGQTLNGKVKTKNRGICNSDYKMSWFAKKSEHLTMKFSNLPLPGNIDIINDKILLVSWDKTVFSVLIHSESLANNLRNYFNEMWLKIVK